MSGSAPINAQQWSQVQRLLDGLELFRQVCEAVSFAHRHLVIHRDLKPGNIRVTPEGQVKLLDFGVAKLMQAEGRTEEFETATILTPEFAAPEQLYGQAVTTATDVYALGAVLFQLLTGIPPFRTEGQAMHLVIDQMLRSEMPQPSGTAAKLPDAPIAPKLLKGDLDAPGAASRSPACMRRRRCARCSPPGRVPAARRKRPPCWPHRCTEGPRPVRRVRSVTRSEQIAAGL